MQLLQLSPLNRLTTIQQLILRHFWLQIQKATSICESNLYVQDNDFISLALFCFFVVNLYLPFLFM